MSSGVCYLLLGDDTRLPLLASLWTLRKHYSGQVAIVTDQIDWVNNLGLMPIDVDKLPGEIMGRLGVLSWRERRLLLLPFCLSLKAAIGQISPYNSTVYLDCDTLVVGDITPLFLPPDDRRIRVTQHCDWTTDHIQIRHRLWQLAHRGIAHPDRMRALMAKAMPAINTGVFAVTRQSAVLREWQETTPAIERLFIHDELALQLLLPDHPYDLVDDRWNCLVGMSARKDAVIHHCVGGQYGMRPEWYEALNEMWNADFAGIRAWLKCNPKLWGA